MAKGRTHYVISQLLAEGVPFTTGDLTKRANISRQAAHRHLRSLVNERYLFRYGAGRGATYVPVQSVQSAIQRLDRDHWLAFSNAPYATTNAPARAVSARHWGSVKKGTVPITRTA